jgi:hypothetical protein
MMNASIKLALPQDRNVDETVQITSFRIRDYLRRFALTDMLEPPGGLGQSGIAVRVAAQASWMQEIALSHRRLKTQSANMPSDSPGGVGVRLGGTKPT